MSICSLLGILNGAILTNVASIDWEKLISPKKCFMLQLPSSEERLSTRFTIIRSLNIEPVAGLDTLGLEEWHFSFLKFKCPLVLSHPVTPSSRGKVADIKIVFLLKCMYWAAFWIIWYYWLRLLCFGSFPRITNEGLITRVWQIPCEHIH